ncbi:cysteine peptidase family C39 domain-containing protein, partial [Streptococcus pneumoniae]|nr:cysteine peptidase family C39 domain-containing protein [Streptococcus pneumoniae]MDS8614434.1 cysteine peptidase family C39 domain-containing protein [Streptococcus pneumoniae]MDT5499126.1 cysteine peptidase family C39 domain-containing protein [Streptococcus pneumoniae]
MLKKYPCTMQHDQSDCAAAVVSTVLLSYKKELSIMKIREIIGTDMYGTTVSGIVSGLNKLNFTVKAVRVALEDLTPKLTFPAILQVKNDLGQNHFVVLHSIKEKINPQLFTPNLKTIQNPCLSLDPGWFLFS